MHLLEGSWRACSATAALAVAAALYHTIWMCPERLGRTLRAKRAGRDQSQACLVLPAARRGSMYLRWLGRLRRSLRRHGLYGTVRLAWIKAVTPLLARRVVEQCRQLEAEFDRACNVDTVGKIPLDCLHVDSPVVEYGSAYQPTNPLVFCKIMQSLGIAHEHFVFVDFGSGKGRAVLLASELPFKKVVGVEFARALHEVACRNLRTFPVEKRQCKDAEVLCMDATQYPIPNDNAVLYFYNPFEAAVMDMVLNNVRQSLQAHPREIYLIFVRVPFAVSVAEFQQIESGLDDSLDVRIFRTCWPDRALSKTSQPPLRDMHPTDR